MGLLSWLNALTCKMFSTGLGTNNFMSITCHVCSCLLLVIVKNTWEGCWIYISNYKTSSLASPRWKGVPISLGSRPRWKMWVTYTIVVLVTYWFNLPLHGVLRESILLLVIIYLLSFCSRSVKNLAISVRRTNNDKKETVLVNNLKSTLFGVNPMLRRLQIKGWT